MAFTDLGSIASGGNSGNNQASLTIATTASCSAGELVVVVVSVDNRATGGGDDTATSGVTIGTSSPFALTKGRQNATNLAAQAGASVSLWWGILPNSVASGQNIVASFTTAASADATALSARHFSYTTGATVSVEATNAGTSTTTNPGSLNATTANLPCLRIRAIGCEWDSTQTLTVTGSWTAWAEGASAASLTVTEQVIEAEHRISTGTGDASAPTLGSACDSASVYVAFKEVYTFAADGSSYSLTGADAALALRHVGGTGSYALTGSDAALTTAAAAAQDAPGWSQWFNPWGPPRRIPPDTVWPNQCLYGVVVVPPDTDNLPAGGANWFNPWGPKRPVQDWFRGPIPTVPVTFTAASGSYTLTGTAATWALGHAAGSGSYSITGNAAALALRHVVGAGSYTLTGGSAVTFAFGQGAAAGSYTSTGSAVTFAFGQVGAAGSYILTGADAALVIPGAVTYLPAGMSGGYVPWRRPFPVNLRTSTGRPLAAAPIVLTAAGGNYVITGSAVSFVVATPPDTTNLPAGATNWFNPWGRRFPINLRISTGRPLAEVTAPVVLTAGAGSYTLTGSSAALALTLTANSGAYTVSGTAAVLARGYAAGAGAYAITGTDANLVQAGSITLTCGAGSYTLTGGADVSFLGVTPPTVEPPTGSYVGRVSGASRGRMIRRLRKDEDLAPPPLEPMPDLAPPPLGPVPPDLKPPVPGLLAADLAPPRTVLRSAPDTDEDEDEDEIALLLELLS